MTRHPTRGFPRPGRQRWLLMGLLVLPPVAASEPSAGAPLAYFAASDLLGQEHSSEQLAGQRTFIVAITDKTAGETMRQWYAAADGRLPVSVQRASLLSLRLPFFISMGKARDVAREHVPPRYWRSTLLDRDGGMARSLGLSSSQQPYVFSVDEHGRVLAVVHGPPDSPDAARIWSSLTRP